MVAKVAELSTASDLEVVMGCCEILVQFHPCADTQRHLKFLLLESVLQV